MWMSEEHQDDLRRVVQSVLWNVSNYPTSAQPFIVGRDMTPLTLKVASAIEAAGFVKTPSEDMEGVHWECDCSPSLGPPHCHACKCPWTEAYHGPVKT